MICSETGTTMGILGQDTPSIAVETVGLLLFTVDPMTLRLFRVFLPFICHNYIPRRNVRVSGFSSYDIKLSLLKKVLRSIILRRFLFNFVILFRLAVIYLLEMRSCVVDSVNYA